jgi:uncharacterized membrane protein
VATQLQQAKRPVSVVAGPYGHPFHPILVTVPIGAWVSSLVFDIASHTAGEEEVFVKGAFWLIAIGVLGAAAAAVFGLLDLLSIPRSTAAFRTGLLHLGLNVAVLGLYVVNFFLRQDGLDEPGGVDTGLIILSAVALALLGVSGWLGGKLAYRYGVRVADEATQAEGFR